MMTEKEFRSIRAEGNIKHSIRYWDKAGTEDGGCNTAGVLMHVTKEKHPRFIISDVVKGQWGYSKREARIKRKSEDDLDLCEQYGERYTVWVEQEPGSSGKESAERTIKNLKGITCKADKVTGDKVVRAQPYEAQIDIKNVFLVKTESDW